MMKRLIFAVTLALSVLSAVPARGQVAVIDVGPENWPVQHSHMITELLRLLAMLNDMLLQARRLEIAGSGETGIFLQSQAEERYGNAITYGSGGTALWPETFTGTHVWEDGGWLESDLETEQRGADTQRTMLRLLERRQEEFAEEEGMIDGLIDGVNSAQGRNQIALRQAKVSVEHLQQSRKEQQLLMAIGNEIAVNNALESNRIVKREAQERWLLTNGDEPVAKPAFHDRGL